MKSALTTLCNNAYFHSSLYQRLEKFVDSIYITSRKYCEGKSIYQQDEEPKKPRQVYGKEYPEWRKPWIKREGEWTSKLSVFNRKNPTPEILNAMQSLPYLNWKQMKDWWMDLKVIQEIENQRYIPERVVKLGANLAAIHFFAYRNSAIRLKDSTDWICGDILKLEFPDTFEEGYYVEAVDCEHFHHNGIRYEGLENLTGLNFLKWLSLKNQKYIDEWCLDRIAGQNGQSLEYLDISGCQFNLGSVIALSKMKALKMVILTDPGDNVELQAALSFLELQNPHLKIQTVEKVEVTPVTEKQS